MERQAYNDAQEYIDQIEKAIDKLELDPNPTESCDAVVRLSDDVMKTLHDAALVERISDAKRRSTPTHPHSFDPSMWPKEIEGAPLCTMTYLDLTKVQWVGLYPHLVEHLLNGATPKRKVYKRKEGGDTVTGDVTSAQFDTFQKVKPYVRLDEAAGLMYFCSAQDRDGLNLYTCRRIMTDRSKMKQVFTAYWHENSVGAHRKATSLHRRLSEMFLGLPRRVLAQLIKQTELDQINRSSGTTYKVTMPLQTSRAREHGQIDLFTYNKKTYANIYDAFSKYCECKRIKNKEAETIIEFLSEFMMKEGFFTILQSDNGSEFVNQKVQSWLASCGVIQRTSRAYRPQSQGGVERLNKTLKGAAHLDWFVTGRDLSDEDLRAIVFAYNTTIHSMTGKTPYEVFRGHKMLWMVNSSDVVTSSHTDWLTVRNMFKTHNPTIPDWWITRYKDAIMADDAATVHYYSAQNPDNPVGVIQPPAIVQSIEPIVSIEEEEEEEEEMEPEPEVSLTLNRRRVVGGFDPSSLDSPPPPTKGSTDPWAGSTPSPIKKMTLRPKKKV